jgi:hypothetical protein
MLSLALSTTSVLALSTPAAADAFLFDWRSNALAPIVAPNPNLTSFNVTWPGLPGQGIAPVTVNIAAYRRSGSGSLTPKPLWWDSTDGIGVESNDPDYGYEPDEVEGKERLVFTFSRPVEIDQILISDLFPNETRDGNTYAERGYFQIDNGPRYEFMADMDGIGTISYPGAQITDGVPPNFAPGSVNGEWSIVLPQPTLVTSLTFSAPGLVDASKCVTYNWKGQCTCYENYTQDHDFSVVGLNMRYNPPPPPPNAVPEPGPMALLGLGVVGLGILRQRRRAD